MKNREIIYLVIAGCSLFAACGESEADKMKRLASNIESNRPLIIESVKNFKTNTPAGYSQMKGLTLEAWFNDLDKYMCEVMKHAKPSNAYERKILPGAIKAACERRIEWWATSTDNNVWEVTRKSIGVNGLGEPNETKKSWKVIIDKKLIAATDSLECGVLDNAMLELLAAKIQNGEQIDFEKSCTAPIELRGGIK